jgi:shikimate kinase
LATPESGADERNIVITGFMGTGKTTIGREIGILLERRFVDSDEVIVARAEATIPQIFARDGEAGFRALEKEVCRDLAAEKRLVIATGGGMLIDPENRALMLASGLVVCLDATAETIRRRLSGSKNRPLAADWETLFEKRREAYAAIPLHVDVTNKTTHKIAQEIIALWRSDSP